MAEMSVVVLLKNSPTNAAGLTTQCQVKNQHIFALLNKVTWVGVDSFGSQQ